VVVTPELARSVEFARELLDDEDLGRNPVLAEWLAAQREALEAALASNDRERLVAVLARLGLAFAAPRGSA
jgi:hypothetical protein